MKAIVDGVSYNSYYKNSEIPSYVNVFKEVADRISNADLRDYGLDGKIVIRDFETGEVLNAVKTIVDPDDKSNYDEYGNLKYEYDDDGKYYKTRYTDLPRRIGKREYVNNEDGSFACALAALYMKETIDKDLADNAGYVSKFSRRWYDKRSEKYLSLDDFGMKPYGGESDVENIEPYASAVYRKISEMQSNLETLQSIYEGEGIEDSQVEEFLSQPNVFDLAVSSIPGRKFVSSANGRYEKQIINSYSKLYGGSMSIQKELVKNDPDFENRVKEVIFDEVQEFEVGDGKKVYIGVLKNGQTTILTQDNFDVMSSKIKKDMIGNLEYGEFEKNATDEEKEVVKNNSCGRGYNSPYFFDSYILWKTLQIVGKEKVESVAEYDGDRRISGLIDNVSTLSKIFSENELKSWDSEKIDKELYHMENYTEHEMLFSILHKKVREVKNDSDIQYGGNIKEADDIKEANDLIGNMEVRKSYYQAKKLGYISRTLNKSLDGDDDYNKSQENKNFDRLNVDDDIADEIITLLKQDRNFAKMCNHHFKSNIGDIYSLFELKKTDEDSINAYSVCYDKKQFIEDVKNKKEGISDIKNLWNQYPDELKEVVTFEEFSMYMENGEAYLEKDMRGFVNYAEKMKENPDLRDVFSGEVSKKSDLDFRLAMSVQNSEVVEWYNNAAKHVGNDVLQKYILRFNTTQEDDSFADLHDALYWSENIKKVDRNEARQLLSNIDTKDEANELTNLLRRYDGERDKLREKGDIQSIRELTKRVALIESNIDLSELPENIVEVVLTAPGGDIVSLMNFKKNRPLEFQSLIDGELDKKQAFKPYKKTYTKEPLNDLLKRALGSRVEKIKGEANNVGKLFSDLKKLISDKELDSGEKMEIKNLFENVPDDIADDVIELLKEQNVHLGPVYTATVHKKSDPEGWVCGNFTDCCMYLGSNINYKYMLDINTCYFTIKENGRIIESSLLVNAFDKTTKEGLCILDNNEVANNSKDKTAVLSSVQLDFFTRYTNKGVKIGTRYNDLVPDGAIIEPNNTQHVSDIGYSDSREHQIYNLPKVKGRESLDDVVAFVNLSQGDIERVVDLENKAYPEGYRQGKGEIEETIKKQRELGIPGAAASFIATKGSKDAGYLIVNPEKSRVHSEQTVAHIDDMVVLPEYQDGRLSKKMLGRVLSSVTAYNVPAVEFEARESTSYRLINNPRIKKWLEKKGFKVVYEEKMENYLGGEDFYYIRLENLNYDENGEQVL